MKSTQDKTGGSKPQPAPQRILVIEDDFAIRNSVEFALRRENFSVKALASGKEAISAVRDFKPDLILLDIMLPDKSGHEICEELRQSDTNTAIIMMSALGETADRIAGLRLGADDYVSKPFSLEELLERVRANLRRSSKTLGSGLGVDGSSDEDAAKLAVLRYDFVGMPAGAKEGSEQDTGGNADRSADTDIMRDVLVVDPFKHEARVHGTKLALRAKEFALLYALVSRPDEVLSRKKLSEEVWGHDHLNSSRTIDVHVRRLRILLSENGAADYLRTIHGVGYRFDAAGCGLKRHED